MWLRNALERRNMKEVRSDGGQGVVAAARSPSFIHLGKRGKNWSALLQSSFVHSLLLIAGWPRGAWVDHELLNK